MSRSLQAGMGRRIRRLRASGMSDLDDHQCTRPAPQTVATSPQGCSATFRSGSLTPIRRNGPARRSGPSGRAAVGDGTPGRDDQPLAADRVVIHHPRNGMRQGAVGER